MCNLWKSNLVIQPLVTVVLPLSCEWSLVRRSFNPMFVLFTGKWYIKASVSAGSYHSVYLLKAVNRGLKTGTWKSSKYETAQWLRLQSNQSNEILPIRLLLLLCFPSFLVFWVTFGLVAVFSHSLFEPFGFGEPIQTFSVERWKTIACSAFPQVQG